MFYGVPWLWHTLSDKTFLVVQSPDVELVEPEDLLVKEEKVDQNMSRVAETEQDVPLIGDDGEYTQYWCMCIEIYPECSTAQDNRDWFKAIQTDL